MLPQESCWLGPSSISCAALYTGTTHINREFLTQYLSKWLGVPGRKDGNRAPSLRHSFVSLFQATLSISVLAFLDMGMTISAEDFMFLVGSFGATAVLLYSAHGSPLAQPRNVMGGHFVSSLAGVTVYKVIGNVPYLSAGLAVGLAIFCMERTNTLHPPGGATALVAIVGGEAVTRAGYWYVLFPCCTGAFMMLVVALVCNNMDPERVYPQYWSDNFPIWHTCRQILGGRCGDCGRKANRAEEEEDSASSRSTSPRRYPRVASIELVDDLDAPAETPPGSPRGRAVTMPSPGHASTRTGAGGHVVDPVVLEEEDTALPV